MFNTCNWSNNEVYDMNEHFFHQKYAQQSRNASTIYNGHYGPYAPINRALHFPAHNRNKFGIHNKFLPTRSVQNFNTGGFPPFNYVPQRYAYAYTN